MRRKYGPAGCEHDPTTGQFLSCDPLVARTHSAYAYVRGNPANLVDPSGADASSPAPPPNTPEWFAWRIQNQTKTIFSSIVDLTADPGHLADAGIPGAVDIATHICNLSDKVGARWRMLQTFYRQFPQQYQAWAGQNNAPSDPNVDLTDPNGAANPLYYDFGPKITDLGDSGVVDTSPIPNLLSDVGSTVDDAGGILLTFVDTNCNAMPSAPQCRPVS